MEKNVKEKAFDVQEDMYRFLATLKPGLWLIDHNKGTNVYSLICTKQEELPNHMTIAQFDRVRYKVAKNISEYLDSSQKKMEETNSGFPTVAAIIECIKEALK